MGIRALFFGALIGVVAACGPPPTPFAITPISSQEPTLAPDAATAAQPGGALPTREPVRYGVLPNAENHAPLDALRQANMQITILDETSDATQFDVMTGFGVYDGWERTDAAPTVSIVFNTALAPLNNTEILAAVRDAIQIPPVLANIPGTELHDAPTGEAQAVKTTLANLGYPTGITVYGKADSYPGARDVPGSMAAANITVLAAPRATAPHIQVIGWDAATQREALVSEFGAENVVDLYTLPISYYLNGDFLTAFTDDGWVIVSRGES
ncbi:MAG: hypothetical protein AAFV33_17460 [Chloroflexota bacterium]